MCARPHWRHGRKEPRPAAHVPGHRVTPYYERHIRRDIEAGRRALVMYLDHIPENKITELNISTGAPLVYGLDEGLGAVRHRYLGDAAAMQAKMQAVKNQGTKRR